MRFGRIFQIVADAHPKMFVEVLTNRANTLEKERKLLTLYMLPTI